jgi:hypothetical protein
MAEAFQQINVALPTHLIEFIRRQAARQDHTVSGAIRHLISEAARREPPAEGKFDFPALPAVPATPEGIAAARERIAAMEAEQEKIRRKKKVYGTTAAEDARHDALHFEIETTQHRLAMAENMLPRSRNGG